MNPKQNAAPKPLTPRSYSETTDDISKYLPWMRQTNQKPKEKK